MIEFKNVSKSYDENKVIKNFSCKIDDKGVTAIVGASGIGKTTFLRLLAGLITPDDGEILCKKKVSFVFQENRLLEDFTCIENTRVADKKDASMYYIEKFGLYGKEHIKVKEFSGGMKRRVAIIRALCHEFDVLLLDEPFDGIDEMSLIPIYEEILEISQKKPVILVSHNMSHLEHLCAKTLNIT